MERIHRSKLENLERFTQLRSLVADNNEIEDLSHLPPLPHLETLWLNNNRIKDIEQVLTVCETHFPMLNYLSLLKNPACPNEFTGNDTDDYQRHRLFVLYRLRNLKFLDSRQVTSRERMEAEKRGKFCKVVTVSDQMYSGVSSLSNIGGGAEGSEGASFGGENKNQEEDDEFDHDGSTTASNGQGIHEQPQSTSYYGYTRHVYTGKHSEGNRFIKNNDL